MTKILKSHGATLGAAASTGSTVRTLSAATKATKSAGFTTPAGPSWPSSAARTWAQNIKPKDFVSIGPTLTDGSERIQFTPDGVAKAQKLVAIFGFDRLPKTTAELQQVLRYCRALDGTLPQRLGRESKEQQRARALGNDEGRQYAQLWVQNHWPAAKDAVLLFAGADMRALRQLHSRLDLMTVFGTRYENSEKPAI